MDGTGASFRIANDLLSGVYSIEYLYWSPIANAKAQSRTPQRHSRPPHPADAGSAPDARLRNCRTYLSGHAWSFSSQGGLSFSSAASPRTGGLDRGGMAGIG